MIIERLDNADISRIGEIDRAEHVTRSYRYEGGSLIPEVVDWRVPRWPNDDSPYSVDARIHEWAALLDEGGVLLGAFNDDLLVGFAIFVPQLTETMAQLAVLHVSKNFRRQGIAQALTARVCQLAIAAGAISLYVSATPTESAVGFYQSQGFQLADHVHPELYALEPEDIHLIKAL